MNQWLSDYFLFWDLNNQIYKVGNVQKQRINITTKTKGKPLDQSDIKKIVKMINEKYIRDKNKEPKIFVRGMSESEFGL